MNPTFNFTAIAICTLIPLLVGWIWYSPGVMGRLIAKENKEETPRSHPPRVYLLTLLASFLVAMLIAGIFSGHAEEDKTLLHGAFHGGAAAIFMGIPTFWVIALFEARSARYIIIHALYWFISMTLMGGVIGFFG